MSRWFDFLAREISINQTHTHVDAEPQEHTTASASVSASLAYIVCTINLCRFFSLGSYLNGCNITVWGIKRGRSFFIHGRHQVAEENTGCALVIQYMLWAVNTPAQWLTMNLNGFVGRNQARIWPDAILFRGGRFDFEANFPRRGVC